MKKPSGSWWESTRSGDVAMPVDASCQGGGRRCGTGSFCGGIQVGGAFQGESRLSTWIYRIAVNKCLNQIRRRQRRKWFLLPGQLPEKQRQEEIAAPAGDLPSAEIERQQRLQRLWQAIDALPENQRKAFVLSRMEDLSYREVADIMGTTLPAVESLLQRARINLQQKLWAFYKKERS